MASLAMDRPMTYDPEIYRIADTLLKKYGPRAPRMVAEGAETMKDKGDMVAHLVWTAVLNAVLECTRTERRPGELVN